MWNLEYTVSAEETNNVCVWGGALYQEDAQNKDGIWCTSNEQKHQAEQDWNLV